MRKLATIDIPSSVQEIGSGALSTVYFELEEPIDGLHLDNVTAYWGQ